MQWPHPSTEVPSEGDAGGLDLRAYLAIGFRSWWIIVLITLLAGGLGYAADWLKTPLYAATARVLVQSAQTPGPVSVEDIEANRRLAEEFQDLLTTRPVLEGTASRMGFAPGSGGLGGEIDSRAIRSIVDVTFTHPDPQMAADIANALAAEAIHRIQQRQLTQIAQLQVLLSQYGIEATAVLIGAQAATVSRLSVVEEAIPPSSPVGPAVLSGGVLGIVLGLAFSLLIVAGREYLGDRVTTMDQLRSVARI